MIILASREASPVRFGSSANSSPSPSPSMQGDESDHSDDEYIDTIEVIYLESSYHLNLPLKGG